MIELIAENLFHTTYVGWQYIESGWSDVLDDIKEDCRLNAEMLLTLIEKAGMLPPLSLSKAQIYPKGHKFHNPDYSGTLEHIWEPEDAE